MSGENNNGIFITLEGPEGAGKTTQIALLAEWLRELGLEVVQTREPGAGELGRQIRALLLEQREAAVSPMAEALLMAADRAQHVDELVRPALSEGKLVLCDRYIDSHIAYQGYGRGLDVGFLRSLNEQAAGLWPDMTLLLLLPPEVGLARADGRGAADRMEAETLAFHQRVAAGYAAIAAEEPGRVRVINADAAAEDVQSDIRTAVLELLRRKGLAE